MEKETWDLLLGNIEEIKGDMKSLRKEVLTSYEKADKRIGSLENWRWYMMGIIGCAGFVVWLIKR